MQDGGKEFIIIPFTQNYSPAVDLVRIIPLENGISVRISDSGRIMQMNLGDHFDTLTSQPLVITSDKTIAVYQYPLQTIPFLNETDVLTGCIMSLIGPDKWGKKYYSVTGAQNIPMISQIIQTIHMYVPPFNPEMHYIRVIKSSVNHKPVYLNGVSMDFSKASSIGKYSYVELPRSPGCDVIECEEPILVITYGGYGMLHRNHPYLLQPRGYSYIPLHK
jgi:hypothetical protein